MGVEADSALRSSAIKNHMQWRGVGEGVEILVARKKRNVSVETSLSDQSVAEARFAAIGQYFRPQKTGALPVAGAPSRYAIHVLVSAAIIEMMGEQRATRDRLSIPPTSG